MNKQKQRTAPIVLILVLLVMAGLFVLFHFLFRDPQEQSITLPEAPAAPVEEDIPARMDQELFVTVTPENLKDLLSTLTLPDAYYQQLTVRLMSGTDERIQTVRVWKQGEQSRAVITSGRDEPEKNYISDGRRLWLWYTGDDEAVQLTGPAVGFDELCGMPDLDAFLNQWSDRLAETSYITLDSGEAGIYCMGRDGDEAGSIWISLDTGLPVLEQREDAEGLYYQARQQDYRVLTPADEAYQNAFILPQGP